MTTAPASIPLVCVGTHEANQALMTDQQLADRFEAVELPPWENDAAFQQLLLGFESILPLRRPSNLRDPQVHQRILSLTEGVMVRICRLLEAAAAEAIRTGEERIDLPFCAGTSSPSPSSPSRTGAAVAPLGGDLSFPEPTAPRAASPP